MEHENHQPEADSEDQLDMEFFQRALKGDNLVEFLDEAQLAQLGADMLTGFREDEESMQGWEDLGKKGLDLARMVSEDRTYPWPKPANAKYPLIAQAALQFNARVYPALAPADSPVKIKVWGKDEDGAKQKRADRVSEFMGFQLSVSRWEDDIDRLTVQLPIIGTVFRKIYYDPVRGLTARNCGRVVLNNDCPNFAQMPRLSEEFCLYPDEIVERIRSDKFIDFDWQGFEGNEEYAPHDFIEQHCRHDLDNDGYPEPYIVTLHKESEKLVRVVANFEADDVTMGQNQKVVRISAKEYYVPYPFFPSFDGTFLGIGLGHLLGNTSEVINGLINQIMDAGHLASLGGGFIGTGLNLKGGSIRIRPGEWQPIPTAGSVIRDAMVPLTFPGPSPVLFQMLGLLIESGKDLASITDVLTGDVQRQQTATTTLALIEQGMMVFNASTKRLFNAMKREFALMARINSKTVSPDVYNLLEDLEEKADPRQDFDLTDMDIQPVADPAQVTSMQRMAKAQLVQELIPGGIVDPREATMRVLEAAGVEDREKLVPEVDPQVEQMKGAQAQMIEALQTELLTQELALKKVEVGKVISETEENRAEALENIADATEGRDNAKIEQMFRYLELLNQARANEAARVGRVAGTPGNTGGSQRTE